MGILQNLGDRKVRRFLRVLNSQQEFCFVLFFGGGDGGGGVSCWFGGLSVKP